MGKKANHNKKTYIMISVIAVAVFVIVWYVTTDVLKVVNTKVIPSPVTIVDSFIAKIVSPNPDGSTLQEHILASLQVALSGYGLGLAVGVPVGIAMAWNRRVDLFLRPLFDLLRPIPPIGWIPVILVLFGIGIFPKVFIVFLATITPVILNAYAGIKQTSDVHLWVAQTFGASRKQLLFKVAIPSAMPLIFTGFRVGLSTAWATLVAAEMLAAQRGLGFMIQMNRTLARADNIIIGMLMIGLLGALLAIVLGLVEKRFFRREAKR